VNQNCSCCAHIKTLASKESEVWVMVLAYTCILVWPTLLVYFLIWILPKFYFLHRKLWQQKYLRWHCCFHMLPYYHLPCLSCWKICWINEYYRAYLQPFPLAQQLSQKLCRFWNLDPPHLFSSAELISSKSPKVPTCNGLSRPGAFWKYFLAHDEALF
jgi:hypothetical protein